jgi:hypothetical protein
LLGIKGEIKMKQFSQLGKPLLLASLMSSVIILGGCSYFQSKEKAQDSNQAVAAQSTVNTISISEVKKAQDEWVAGLIKIGKVYTAKGNYEMAASHLIDKLYAYNYEEGVVLFKPTKAKVDQFRGEHDSALSYFVGGNPQYDEDKGFALAPWTKIVFHNDAFYKHGDMALVMGEYTFTNAAGNSADVEYTFGYVRDDKGNLKIILHHSSLPYQGGAPE